MNAVVDADTPANAPVVSARRSCGTATRDAEPTAPKPQAVDTQAAACGGSKETSHPPNNVRPAPTVGQYGSNARAADSLRGGCGLNALRPHRPVHAPRAYPLRTATKTIGFTVLRTASTGDAGRRYLSDPEALRVRMDCGRVTPSIWLKNKQCRDNEDLEATRAERCDTRRPTIPSSNRTAARESANSLKGLHPPKVDTFPDPSGRTDSRVTKVKPAPSV